MQQWGKVRGGQDETSPPRQIRDHIDGGWKSPGLRTRAAATSPAIIPIVGTTTDGNGSDKTLNNELLTNISKYLAKHGLEPGAYVDVADSAFVTEDNLANSYGDGFLRNLFDR